MLIAIGKTMVIDVAKINLIKIYWVHLILTYLHPKIILNMFLNVLIKSLKVAFFDESIFEDSILYISKI